MYESVLVPHDGALLHLTELTEELGQITSCTMLRKLAHVQLGTYELVGRVDGL